MDLSRFNKRFGECSPVLDSKRSSRDKEANIPKKTVMDWKTAFKNLQSQPESSSTSFSSALYQKVPYGWELKKTNPEGKDRSKAILQKNKEKKPSTELKEIVKSMESWAEQKALSLESPSLFGQASHQCLFVSKAMEQEGSPAYELLEKMRLAMDLESFSLCLSLNEENAKGQVSQAIVESKPRYVLAFGGLAVQSLWGEQRRLSAINGQFFPALIKDKAGTVHKFQIVPLFHPDYLLVNPQMKRGVWESLKEVMKSLGKKV